MKMSKSVNFYEYTIERCLKFMEKNVLLFLFGKYENARRISNSIFTIRQHSSGRAFVFCRNAYSIKWRSAK